jgi:hypothetical protein
MTLVNFVVGDLCRLNKLHPLNVCAGLEPRSTVGGLALLPPPVPRLSLAPPQISRRGLIRGWV